jgi:hypothetical protein
MGCIDSFILEFAYADPKRFERLVAEARVQERSAEESKKDSS